MNEIKDFAIDFGNGYVKAKSNKQEFTYPAKFGFEEKLGTSSLEILEDSYNVNTFNYKNDRKYVVGHDVEDVFQPKDLIATDSKNNRYAKKAFQQLVDAVLADLASLEDSKTVDVRLITGMPSDDLAHEGSKESFVNFLKGHHIIQKNGEEYVINVKELRLIEQPLGTLLNVFMTNDGKVHKDLKHGLIVVIDFGSGTTIVDIYQNMKRIGGDSSSEGMIKFYEDIASRMKKNKKLQYTPDINFIEKGIVNKTYTAEYGQEKHEFKDILKEVLEEKLLDITQLYERIAGNDDLINDFIINGGGSYTLGDEIKQENPKFRLLDSPQTSTVNGYFKLGNSLRKDA